MKSSKKALAFALAAAMVVTAFPVTNAEAASTAKLSTTKVTVAAGTAKKQTKSIKVTTPSTWKSVKVKVSSSNKKVAKVKASGKTVKVTAVKKGSAKVTVKVTAKKGNKKVSKTLTAKAAVINAGLRFTAAPTEMVVGAEDKVVAKKSPSVAKVTYASSDDAVATVDATTGAVKAVKAGKVTITATSDYGKTATTDIEVKKAILKSATQTEYNKIEAVIVGDTKELKAGDFKVTNTATNGTVAVKAVTAKKNAADTFVIETFTGMTDAKDYSVEYAGSKTTFTATNGTVAKVGVTPVEVAAAEKTPVSLTTLDANGVVLGYTPLNNSDSSKGKVTATTKYAKGYVDGTDVYLPTVGDTMTVDVTYHTGSFGTDGKETGNITGSFTVTAVDPALINLNYAVTIAASAPAWTANSFKSSNQVKLGADAKAYFRITKESGAEITNYGDYKVESADKTKLLVNADTLAASSTAVTVRGVSEGTTYILIKKNDTTVASLPITITAAPVATTLELSKTAVSVMQGKNVPETVKLTIKDQYGDAMNVDSSSVSILGKPSNSTVTNAGSTNSAVFTTSGSLFGSAANDIGTFTVKITAKNGNVELTRALAVNVVKAATTATDYEVRFDQAEVDTTIGSGAVTTSATDIKVTTVRKANGAAIDSVANEVQYTIKNSEGKVVYYNGDLDSTNAMTTANAVTGAAFTTTGALSSNELTVNTITSSATNTYDKNLAAGTYYVTAKFEGDNHTVVTVGSTFTIKDSQDTKASFLIQDNAFGTTTVAQAFEGATNTNGQKFVKVFYDGIEQTLSTGDVIEVKGNALANGGAFIKTVKLYVKVSGGVGNKVPVTLTVNDQIASCPVTGIN